MTTLVDRLAPEAIKKLIPYQSARRIGGSGRLWLNANELEQPIAYSSIVDNNDQNTLSDYNRYPDFLPTDIATAYQQYCNTSVPTLAVRGADEAIDLIIRTFCQPAKDKILICSPTYAMYEFCADAFTVGTIDVPLSLPSFTLNVDEIASKATEANVVFLCSPNNPTGNLLAKETIIEVLEKTSDSALVVVDEAYIDFEIESNLVTLIEQYPNLIVIRTLSKAFGLAAVRCGFILTNPEIMGYLKKLIPPYPMPDSSSHIVLQALSNDGLLKMRQRVDELNATKEKFIDSIRHLKWIETIYPSATNFVLIKTDSSINLFQYLLDQGIVTRNQSHEPALSDCVRITIGTPQTMHEVTTLLLQLNNSTEL
ncbi:histidinol-phosphate transaminase [Vibrio sp. TH_r3]|uniref:histidinol-phosphate transaminase n=1 Tax=Vibrio sp. TH_r3 TaxID=3082084 RepID=UPI002954BEB7|nr:histidinol-phosphate transaminase [Vibrio sp. TH_r3]MDV7105976.1 histidinol-phosphate transaminase [Vibrio sp. TH_r3]